MIDIIPDIHGQATKLEVALSRLGWRKAATGWHHADPAREIFFLGDLIDRGPDNRAVLSTVRALVDSGKARAIMGNHELNALHFHTSDPSTGQPLRDRSPKNIQQHRSFLEEFPIGDAQTRDMLGWMQQLPLFLERSGVRIVHACWNETSIADLDRRTSNGILSFEQLVRAAQPSKDKALYGLVEEATKGPEYPLPAGWSYLDKNGTARTDIRLKWWQTGGETWNDIAISVPSPSDLPDGSAPPTVLLNSYPKTAPPVFFGHYWLTGQPFCQGDNVLCLDYSAGKDGPLVTYELEDARAPLSSNNIRVHPAQS